MDNSAYTAVLQYLCQVTCLPILDQLHERIIIFCVRIGSDTRQAHAAVNVVIAFSSRKVIWPDLREATPKILP